MFSFRSAALPAPRPGLGILRRMLPKGKPVLLPAGELPMETAEGFGMVIRDPFYEWNRHPLHPNAPNYEFLAAMANNLYTLGVRWVRLEFHAEEGNNYGSIDWRKYDWFVNEAAPRFGLKILALFNVGILKGPGSELGALQDVGSANRHDGYVMAFSKRAVEIARRYGERLHAYEILNEPNKSGALAVETQGKQDELAPEAVGGLISTLFPRLKAIQDVPVVLGGLLTGTNKASQRDSRAYLDALYRSAAVQSFRTAQSRWPWDAVGLHPYHDGDNNANTPQEVLAKLDAVYSVMQAHGDAGTIWVTEIGMEAGTATGGEGPSDGEIKQANFLNGVFTGALMTRRAFVERLFWFKYEDIWVGRDETWGVVRLAGGATDYDPNGAIARRRAAFDIYSALTPPPPALGMASPAPPANLRVNQRVGGEISFAWDAGTPTIHPIKTHQLFRSSRADMSKAVHVASVAGGLQVAGRAPRGTNYYAVRAVDSAVPPNVSPFSNVVKVARLL